LKLLEVKSLANGIEVLAPMIEASPDMIDNWDTDAIARGVPERLGWSEDWLRDIDERDEIREMRMIQMQQERVQEMALEAAKSAGQLGKAVEPGSIISEAARQVA